MDAVMNIKSLAGDLYRLFFPETCAACGKKVPEGVGFLCALCRMEIPLTGFWTSKENSVKERFGGQLIVENASAFFHYIHGSGFRDLIHRFKYSGGWRAARQMGLWYGSCLADSGLYGDIDYVVPVPLHRRKLLKRGYNQAEFIARGIAEGLGVEVCPHNLVRTRHGKSQTRIEGNERWDNVHGAFKVARPALFEGRHILLVDDVLTTGATLTACGEAILTSVGDVRLSIAALAVAKSPAGR